ncbi:leucine aminopeptidase-like [Hibiscus syriacus]|uniref:leucine aminopeptidase-like n=1 Tax=Hibiscus syriacus TaxID=106335 RepID=UPI001921B3A5|nr:leucine aminopeptidase-like [Hibiscus syriacus]
MVDNRSSQQTGDSVAMDSTNSPSSTSIKWLSLPYTFNKKHPFVYTQCQSIHARSIFPYQDTPAARICYTSLLNIPHELSAIMSASHVESRPLVFDEGHSHILSYGFNLLWSSKTRVIEQFHINHLILPYLFAFAVGELGSREVGPRTTIYVEAVDSLLDAAAKEFAGTEEMIMQGEKLFGKYPWERFDLLVLPPSFPYGGMENPMMVFLTPTVIKGDVSGAQVVAHELAHSWTGS